MSFVPPLLALLALAHAPADTDTFSHVVTLPPVEVSTSHFSAVQPPSRTTVSRDEAQAKNWGEDTPMALMTLPGAYAYSDAGNGIGYSYLTLRGFPQRRISVMINGVPLNDPESHEVYWIDHPDLLASTAQLTVQRGVGSDLYGAAAVGGAVNVVTSPFTHGPEQNVTVEYGDFETKRLSIESNSGDLPGGWNTYARYSRIETFGYREQSWSRLWSYTVSAKKVFSPRQSAQINLYGGPEETHLAYLGVPRALLAIDRRFNPLTYPNERDHFFEPHYELLHTWAPRENTTLSQTFFWFDGRGYYDEQRFANALGDYRLAPWITADSTLAPRTYYAQNPDGSLVQNGSGRFTLESTDVVRRRSITDRHFGWVPRASVKTSATTRLTAGGELRFHDGHHYGEVKSGSDLPPGTPPDFKYYDYHPRTMESGAFARLEWTPTAKLGALADVAYRHVSYSMRDDHFDAIRFEQRYDFVSPRLAAQWSFATDLRASASWAATRREPAFQDLYEGEDLGNTPLFARVDAHGLWVDPLIRPERVNDWEAGVHWSKHLSPSEAYGVFASGIALGVDLYRMDFRDELVDAGQFNTDLGYPILGNAAQSVHQGVEIEALAASAPVGGLRVQLDGNASLSDNHFVHYAEADGPTPADMSKFDGHVIPYFPAVLANAGLTLGTRGTELRGEVQYAGRQYLDNTQSKDASIAPHTVVNARARYVVGRGPWKGLALGVRVLNALNTKYEASGYMDFDANGNLVPNVIPAATRAVIGEVSARF